MCWKNIVITTIRISLRVSTSKDSSSGKAENAFSEIRLRRCLDRIIAKISKTKEKILTIVAVMTSHSADVRQIDDTNIGVSVKFV